MYSDWIDACKEAKTRDEAQRRERRDDDLPLAQRARGTLGKKRPAPQEEDEEEEELPDYRPAQKLKEKPAAADEDADEEDGEAEVEAGADEQPIEAAVDDEAHEVTAKQEDVEEEEPAPRVKRPVVQDDEDDE